MTIEEEALGLMEPGKELGEEALSRLESNEELRRACEDISLVAECLVLSAGEPSDDEVERRLGRFMNRRKARGRHGRPFIWIAAAAALALIVVAATVVLIPRGSQQAEQEAEALIFRSDPQPEMSIVSQSGQPIPLTITPQTNAAEPLLSIGHTTPLQAMADTMTLTMPHGKACQVSLPDGSRVHLHPGSRLVFPQQFTGPVRDVFLEGQAYFVVKTDKEHPFRVHTDNTLTTATGTEFDVTAYKGSQPTVTLISGHITFADPTMDRQVEMVAGQQATLTPTGYIDVMEADTLVFTAWRDGYLYYDHATLREILTQIGRCYNVSITCHSPALLTYRMHFALRRDEDLDYVASMLNRMKKVSASVADGRLVIE